MEITPKYYAARMNALRKTTKSLKPYNLPFDDTVKVLRMVTAQLRDLADSIDNDLKEARMDQLQAEAEREREQERG